MSAITDGLRIINTRTGGVFDSRCQRCSKLESLALIDKQLRMGLDWKTWSDGPFYKCICQITVCGFGDGLNLLTRPCHVAECLNTLANEEENWSLSVSKCEYVSLGSMIINVSHLVDFYKINHSKNGSFPFRDLSVMRWHPVFRVCVFFPLSKLTSALPAPWIFTY